MTVTETAARPAVGAPLPGDRRDVLPTRGRMRPGSWPRHVAVEITRIRSRLRVALAAHHGDPRSAAVAEAVEKHLADADAAIRRPRGLRRSPVDWWRGSAIEEAYRSLHAARAFLVELVDHEAVEALVPGVVARVQSCLPATDPQRLKVEELPAMTDPRAKRAQLVHALEVGYDASDEAHTRIRRFRNVLLAAALMIAALTLLMVHGVAANPTAVPLCFQPDLTSAEAAVSGDANSTRTVCPGAEQPAGGTAVQPTWVDVWIVAGLGLLGGGLAAAIAVRNVVSSATPYDVPLALALLKVPTGALTAVTGILLLGGGFVPGLSELDSQRQILAYALLFGYAQQFATRYLDNRASTLLAEIPSKHALTQTRSLPGEDARKPAEPTQATT